MKHAEFLICISASLVSSTGLCAQGDDPASRPDSRPALTQKISWPADRDRIVCSVAGVDFTALEMLEYVQKHHWPGLLEFLELPAGRLYFETPLIPRWVQQFADIVALRNEAQLQSIEAADARPFLEAGLKRGFEQWLGLYTADRARRGITAALTQDAINVLLTKYQAEFGLQTELDGWLSALVTPLSLEADSKLRDYYAEHTAFFGGVVAISQILVRNRDERTGELLIGEAKSRYVRKLHDVESRLAKDGSNFEEVARLLSEDRVTSGDGGILREVPRFDSKLPAVLRRTAWDLSDGEWAGPIESEYGMLFVKRLSSAHRQYMFFTDAMKPIVVGVHGQQEREKMLFAARDRQMVELRY